MSLHLRIGAVAAAMATLAGLGCAKDPCDVVVYTYVEQTFSGPILETFEADTGLRVCASFSGFEIKAAGILHRILAEKDAPSVDVLWADDPIRPYMLARQGVIEPYRSPERKTIPEAFKDEGGLWTGVGAQARVLLVNTKKVRAGAEPKSIRDLADPRWKGRAALPNPLHGTTLVQMAGLAVHWGDAGFVKFLDALQANEVRVSTTSWEVKNLVAKGDAAVGLTNSDHADEAVASGAPVAVVLPDQEPGGLGTLVIPTSVLRIKNGPHPEAARRLIDYLLSPAAEAALCGSGAYFPLRAETSAGAGKRRLDEIRAMSLDFEKSGEALERVRPAVERWLGR